MTTLNSRQQHSYSITQQLTRFLCKSKRIYASVNPFRNEVETLIRHFDSISGQAAIKAKKGTAITAQKKAMKKELAREAATICTLATAYALDTNNTKLLAHVNHGYTDIYTTKDSLLYFGISLITHIITPYLEKEDFQGYGITSQSLASITGKSEQFRDIIGSGKWINWESNLASSNITATLKKIKASIKQLNRLLVLFKDTHPDFVLNYQQALIINGKEKARNTLEGTITDSNTGQPVQGVTITLEGSTKTATTNISGFFYLTGLKVGMQKIIITAAGYAPQTIEVRIMRGKTTTWNMQLQSNTYAMPAVEVA